MCKIFDCISGNSHLKSLKNIMLKRKMFCGKFIFHFKSREKVFEWYLENRV